MPKDTQSQKEQIKVTDRRIFTAEGEIREEFRNEIRTSDAPAVKRAPEPAADEPKTKTTPETTERGTPGPERDHGERRRTLKDKAANPNTAFTDFIEPLIAQAYIHLGMLRNPYQPQAKIDSVAARQMIEILTLLKEKTQNNLTPDEDEFLSTHLGELKLAFVQRTKTI